MKEKDQSRRETLEKAEEIIREMQCATGKKVDLLADELDFLISQNLWLESTDNKKMSPLGRFVADELQKEE